MVLGRTGDRVKYIGFERLGLNPDKNTSFLILG